MSRPIPPPCPPPPPPRPKPSDLVELRVCAACPIQEEGGWLGIAPGGDWSFVLWVDGDPRSWWVA